MTNPQNDENFNFSDSNIELPSAEDDFTIDSETKSKKKLKKWQKIIIIILAILLSLVILLVGSFYTLWLIGRSRLLNKNVVLKPDKGIEVQIEDDNTVIYNGNRYKYNENITTVLCMGIDNYKDSTGPSAGIGKAGQTDALYLLVIDTATGKVSALAIPRDTIAEVDIYSKSGSYSGVKKAQICLAFAYGDGKEKSCENVIRSVSRLLYGMPISSYFAIDYRSLKNIHNAVGTLTVKPNEALKISYSNRTDTTANGFPYKITEANIEAYLRARNKTDINAAYLRMERQIDYLKQYSAVAFSKTKEDITFPIKIYNKIIDNSITDIDPAKITFLASCAVKNSSNIKLDVAKLNGEYTIGDDGFAELTLDSQKTFDTVISLFYQKVD